MGFLLTSKTVCMKNYLKREHPIDKRLRYYRIVFPFSILTVLVTILASLYLGDDTQNKMVGPEFIVSLLSLGLASSMTILYYLQSRSVKASNGEDESTNPEPTLSVSLAIKDFQERLRKIESDISQIALSTSAISLMPEDKDRLFKYVEQNFSKNVNEDIYRFFEQKFQELRKEQQRFEDIMFDFTGIKERIKYELKSLNLRANINMAIGSGTTFCAFVVLYLAIPKESAITTLLDTMTLLQHYIPRLTIIILIESFAFFFLRLYKSNMEDVKYYHNELTNVEMKLISLKQAVKLGQHGISSRILAELSKTERNFILKKGETTTELTKIRYESDFYKGLIETFKAITKVAK